MKKTLYIILLFIVTSLAISSCTEQEIKPKTIVTGGGALDPKG